MRQTTSVDAAEGRYDEAEEYARRALSIMKVQVGPRHPDLATTQVNLAMIVASGGKSFEAHRLLRSSLSIRRRAFGVESTMETLDSLASLERRMGDCVAEHATLRRLLRIERAVELPDPRWHAITMKRIGDSSRRCGALVRAAGEYESALPLIRANGGRGSLSALVSDYAIVLRQLNREADAVSLEREVLANN